MSSRLISLNSVGISERGGWWWRSDLRFLIEFSTTDSLILQLVKALRAADQRCDPHFLCGDFSGSSRTSDIKLALPWLPCQAPGFKGSALRLVVPVSVIL